MPKIKNFSLASDSSKRPKIGKDYAFPSLLQIRDKAFIIRNGRVMNKGNALGNLAKLTCSLRDSTPFVINSAAALSLAASWKDPPCSFL